VNPPFVSSPLLRSILQTVVTRPAIFFIVVLGQQKTARRVFISDLQNELKAKEYRKKKDPNRSGHCHCVVAGDFDTSRTQQGISLEKKRRLEKKDGTLDLDVTLEDNPWPNASDYSQEILMPRGAESRVFAQMHPSPPLTVVIVVVLLLLSVLLLLC